MPIKDWRLPKNFLNIKYLMSIPSPLKQYHFRAILIWWHSPFKLWGNSKKSWPKSGWSWSLFFATVADKHNRSVDTLFTNFIPSHLPVSNLTFPKSHTKSCVAENSSQFVRWLGTLSIHYTWELGMECMLPEISCDVASQQPGRGGGVFTS